MNRDHAAISVVKQKKKEIKDNKKSSRFFVTFVRDGS